MRVVVVGGGLLGVATAYFLIRDGHEVTLVERHDQLAVEGSYANGGMVTPSQAAPWNTPGIGLQALRWIGKADAPLLLRPRTLPRMAGWALAFLRHSSPSRHRAATERNIRLANYSLQTLRAIRAEEGFRYDDAARGTLKIAHDQSALDGQGEFVTRLAAHGLDAEILDAARVIELEPALAPVADTLAGGVFFPDDEHGDSRQFAERLAERSAELGMQLRLGSPVTALEREGHRVTAVLTTRERLPADAVVLAAASYTPGLLRPLGLKLPVKPVKGYSITVPFDGWNAPPRIPVVDEGLHVGITPLGDRLRIAGTAEFAGFDTVPGQARTEAVLELGLAVFPGFAAHLDRRRMLPWSGLRPVSPDGSPFIGRFGPANLYVNAGHGHLGWTMACGSGRLLADLIGGHPPDLDIAPFAPGRPV